VPYAEIKFNPVTLNKWSNNCGSRKVKRGSLESRLCTTSIHLSDSFLIFCTRVHLSLSKKMDVWTLNYISLITKDTRKKGIHISSTCNSEEKFKGCHYVDIQLISDNQQINGHINQVNVGIHQNYGYNLKINHGNADLLPTHITKKQSWIHFLYLWKLVCSLKFYISYRQ
jgi:hypothetical protein